MEPHGVILASSYRDYPAQRSGQKVMCNTVDDAVN
jgi:hypothetical protein